MTSIELLAEADLPPGFIYPHEFRRMVDLGIVDMEPWYVIQGEVLRNALQGLRARYPDSGLVPFARRQDNDDIACWPAPFAGEVLIVHDFASPGWEQRARFATFYDWFRQAVEDFIEFDT